MIYDSILTHPGFKQPFIFDTDARNLAIVAVLCQRLNGQENVHVIAYASRTRLKLEKQYCFTMKELLALVVCFFL